MNLSTMFQTWFTVLTSPNEETFEIEKQKQATGFDTAMIWMVVATVIAMFFGLLQAAIGFATFNSMGALEQLLNDPNIPSEFKELVPTLFSGGGLATMAGVGVVLNFFYVLIAFVLGAFILHLLATMLGGRGTLGKFAYLRATYLAPLTVINSILGLIPVLGGCLAILSIIYQIILAYFATKVNYGLSKGKAITVVLIPVILVLVLFICIVSLVAGAAFSAN